VLLTISLGDSGGTMAVTRIPDAGLPVVVRNTPVTAPSCACGLGVCRRSNKSGKEIILMAHYIAELKSR